MENSLSPEDRAMWAELHAAEARAASQFVVQELQQADFEVIRRYPQFVLRGPQGGEVLYHRDDRFSAAVRSAYLAGIAAERVWQNAATDRRRAREWLAIGAAAFFGVSLGMMLTALLTWSMR
jgi:hypothetical protein